MSIIVAALGFVAAIFAFFGTAAHVSSFGYEAERSGWIELANSPIPRLWRDTSIFFRPLPDDPHPDIVRARQMRFALLGWKHLRFATGVAAAGALLNLVHQVVLALVRGAA